jgi:predicted amidohydrolase
MKVGFCQYKVAYKNPDANLNKIKDMISGSDADLIVLPELCLSGYYFKTKEELYEYADESVQTRMISELQIIAKSKDLYIVAGIAEKKKDKLYNSAFVIGPEGLIGKHRKVNLTVNEKIFDRGNGFEILNIGNVKIGIVICFDSWFPESYRLLSLKGAQIICCPANFGGHWTPDVLKIRSLENKVFTVLSNRSGIEIVENVEEQFRGESQIIDYEGTVLAKAVQEECLMIIDIDPDDVIKKNNMISDDMNFELGMYKDFVKYKI